MYLEGGALVEESSESFFQSHRDDVDDYISPTAALTCRSAYFALVNR